MYILKKKTQKNKISYYNLSDGVESLILITFSYSVIRRFRNSCLIAFYYLHAQICSTHP